jgi:hypothetical protein
MIVLAVALCICAWFSIKCLPFQEARTDTVVLKDRFLDLFPRKDCSYPIAFLCAIVPVACNLELIWRGLFFQVEIMWFKYAVCMILKGYVMYVCPLDVPEGHIVLTDPVSMCFTKKGQVYNKDLFFSGHTVLMVLCSATSVSFSAPYHAASALMSLLLLITRNHYTIDIVGGYAAACCVGGLVDKYVFVLDKINVF